MGRRRDRFTQARSGRFPLTMARCGESGTVVEVGGDDETRKRMSDLGFTAGAVLSVIGRSAGGVIVDVRGSRVALDPAVASDMLIEAV